MAKGNDASDMRKKARNPRKYLWYVLLFYSIFAQFLLVFCMGKLGDLFVSGEDISREEKIVIAAVLTVTMFSVVLCGILRRKLEHSAKEQSLPGRWEENGCICLVAAAGMFWVEWIVAGVALTLLPVWFLFWWLTEWQKKNLIRKKNRQNRVIKEYIREYTAQLPSMHLCHLAPMEREQFAEVLRQKKETLGVRLLQGALAAAMRLGSGFLYLAMGSILCLLAYEGEMEIGEVLLFLFSFNTMMTSLAVILNDGSEKMRIT